MKRTVDNSKLMLVTDYKLADMCACKGVDILQIETANNNLYLAEVVINETTK